METLKKGNHWTACYDKEHNRYVAKIMYISREGCEDYEYLITKEVFDRLGSFAEDYENDQLIRDTGESLYRFEDTMYGTPGPIKSVFDENHDKIWKDAYNSASGNTKKGKRGKGKK